jgi:radical SAM protein with 4Fe4S-binding SPASM domain
VGGNLNKVLEGARNIVKWKKELKSRTPFIFFQFLVVKPNEHQVKEIETLAREIGVDEVRFKTAQIYDYENDPNQLIPTIEKFSRYKKTREGKVEFKNDLPNHCWRLWHATVITWDGLVVPCCFDKDAVNRLGDLKGKPFREIWHNEQYVDFRRQILHSRKNIEICSNCSEGTKVWS